MRLCYFIFILLYSTILFSQNIGNIKGRVLDAKLLSPLQGSTVIIEGTSKGVITDKNGYFKFENVETKTYNVVVGFLGYKSQIKYNVLVKSVGTSDLLFKLEETAQSLDEVVVLNSSFSTSKETPLSNQTFSAIEIETYPGGNNDITKVAQSLPGISPSIGGFRNDFIIRGGAPNETVYYLDGIEIPNINHFSTQGSAGGPVGMVNIDFVRQVSLATSAFGAEFDNPLSGVLVFEQREGNDQKMNGKVRLGASEAGITINTPLFIVDKKRSNTSLMLSLRRSYLQYVFEFVGLPIRPDYWDYQFKLNHKIDNYNTITFLGLGSIDDFSVTEPEEFDSEIQATIEQVPIIKQQTLTLGLSWTRKYKSGKGRVRTTFSTNKFQNIFSRFTNNIDKKGVVFENNSKEKESKIRIHFTEFSDELKFSYGFNFQHSLYTNSTSGVLNEINYNTSIDFLKYGFFGQISRSFYNNKLSISFGLRTDADSFSNGSGLLNNLSPRLSVSYIFSEDQKWKLNTSLGRYFKIPTYTMLGFKDSEDKFINRKNRYTQSNHCVIGLEYNLETTSRITLEGFLKDYSQYPVSVLDQVSIANKGGGFEVLGNEPIVDSGRGNTYGLELLFQQKLSRRVYGILAYTHFFSQFSRKNGPLLPTVWDSRNLLSFTGGYKLKRNWEFSLRYRYAGKTPYAKTNLALTSKSYPIIILDYNSLNYEKIGAFSQGDIRIDKKWNFKNLSFNFYIDIQNFLSQSTPEPQEYGLQRDIDGSIIIPRNIVPIDTDSPNSLIPSFGFVFDF